MVKKLHKKGLIYGFALTSIFTLVMGTAFFLLQAKTGIIDKRIGEAQTEVLQLYNQGEFTQIFLEESAKQALIQTVYDFGQTGMITDYSCADLIGYPVWNNGTHDCKPSSKEAEALFKKMYATNLNKALLNSKQVGFPKITTGDFTYTNGKIKSNSNKEIKISKISLTVKKDKLFGILPVEDTYLTSCFGYRGCVNPLPDGTCQGTTNHKGLDLGTNQKSEPVYAVADGKVEKVVKEWGKIVIDHERKTVKSGKVNTEYEGIRTEYIHLDKINVQEGDQVTKGQQIGMSGGRGPKKGANEYPIHLHFGVYDDSVPDALKDTGRVDPLPYFIGREELLESCGTSCPLNCLNKGAQAQYSLPLVFETQRLEINISKKIEVLSKAIKTIQEICENANNIEACSITATSTLVDINSQCESDFDFDGQNILICTTAEDVECGFSETDAECQQRISSNKHTYYDSINQSIKTEILQIQAYLYIPKEEEEFDASSLIETADPDATATS